MNKLAIVSSKKYFKSKQAVELINYLDKQKIIYEKILADSELQNSDNEASFELIISVGGDGTALKAMSLGWKLSVPVLNLGSGTVGYLVNSFDRFLFFYLLNSFEVFKSALTRNV